MTITPAMAEKWLAATTFRNRDVSMVVINRYASDMAAGKWALNGESIVLDDNGNVIDGQHRLRAIIKAGVPIKSLVVRGADHSVFPTFDIGAKRGGKDVLSIAGYANARSLAAILKNIVALDSSGFSNGPRGGGSLVKHRLDYLQLANNHPESIQSTSFVQSHHSSCEILRPVSFAGCMHYDFGRQNPDARDAFFNAIVNRTPYFSQNCQTTALWKKYSIIRIQKEMALSVKVRHEVWLSCWTPFKARFKTQQPSFAKQETFQLKKMSQATAY